jgi:transcription initiation factor TFIID subunit 2
MKAVTAALIPTGESFHFGFGMEDEEIKNSTFSELERLLRMDRWVPSFQYTISQAALAAKEQLAIKGIGTLAFSELLLYVREGIFDILRAQAYDILLKLGALRHAPLVRLIFYTLRSDPSPFIRRRLVWAIGRGLGSMALTGKNVQARPQPTSDEMVIEEDAAQSVAVRKDLLERANIAGAIQALRAELADDDTLKAEMWKCAKHALTRISHCSSSQLDLAIRQHVLSFCRILYDEKTSYMVVLNLPKKRKRFVCHNLGKVVSSSHVDCRAKLSCVGNMRERRHQSGSQLHRLLLRQWHLRQ